MSAFPIDAAVMSKTTLPGVPLKIALVILHADAHKGGAERYTLQIAHALAGRGHQVSLLATTHAEPVAGVNPVVLQAGGRTKTARYLGFLKRLDEFLAEHPCDIVHAMLPVRRCDLYHPHAGLATEALAKGHLKHANTLVRGLSWLCNQANSRRRAYAATETEMLKEPDAPGILCLSEYVKAAVRRRFFLPEHKLHTLFNAVDLDVFAPGGDPSVRGTLRERFGIGSQEPVGLMVAQDFARKGLAEVIQAMAQLPRNSMRLLVIGKDDPARYRRQAKLAGLQDAVVFAGPTSDVRPFYRAADFMVMPTRHDPCSLVVLEALAMGVPVISTRFNGACEIMTDGTHGCVLADPGDISTLASAMRGMLDPQQREKMSGACLALRLRLDFNSHIDQLLAIYRGVKSARDRRAQSAPAHSRQPAIAQ